MNPVSTSRVSRSGMPSFVQHPDFESPDAASLFAAEDVADEQEFADKYMPDEVTRDYARRMHYAASRVHAAKSLSDRVRWERTYYRLRDAIVLGNRKLIYRAVRRRLVVTNRSDDFIGDCHIVMIQAVAAYNPWMGIRFSTYAYTCLIRALSRMAQRLASDKLAHSLSLDSLPDGIPNRRSDLEPSSSSSIRIDDFLRTDHPLLNEREKLIISRRFCPADARTIPTLEKVGQELGLSKERVRQVQASALDKLRKALKDQTQAV